jgi:carboxyl-terminal processing protease
MEISTMKHYKVAFLVSLFIISAFTISSIVAEDEEQVTVSVSHQEIQRFGTAIAQIKNLYIRVVTDRELFSSAIHGMLMALDPHSAYLNRKALQNLSVHTDGQFVGLGIEVTQEKGLIKVISPIDDTPAQKAGIQAGDYILAIDHKHLLDTSLEDAIQQLRGKKGTIATLTVINKNDQQERDIKVKRDVIKIKSVNSKLLHEDFGYVRITHFQQHTKDQVSRAVDLLHKEAGGQLKGLILDLRNNPGGILEASSEVADLFLDPKQDREIKIFYTKGRAEDSEMTVYATPGDILYSAPLIVLINEGSASASEIVAGALQDHKRAIVMGKRSFGKGSIQSIFPVDDESAIKLTTALYYTPSGRSIQAEGIQPDIVVDNLKLVKEKEEILFFWKIREKDLKRHLKNGSKKTPQAIESNLNILATSDYQLYEALKLLKSMHIFQKRQDT